MLQMHDDWQVAGSQLNSKTPPQGAQVAWQAILLPVQQPAACAPAGTEDPATARAGRSSRTKRLRWIVLLMRYSFPQGQMLQTQFEWHPGNSRVQLNSKTPQSQLAAHCANRTAQQEPAGGADWAAPRPGARTMRVRAKIRSKAFLMVQLLGG
jgi:hypothetical protein